jgi:hypothetical protein|tara:strand:- start:46 stop:423 length:378 start_codon:yes stop_codon:yes gene_type:complete
MAHFTKLDENNQVVQVIVISNEITTPDGVNEDEQLGIDFISALYGGVWKQTSYNNNFRKKYAGVGYTYDETADVFIVPQPFPSWSLDGNYDWQPPVPRPEGDYLWNEPTLSWYPVSGPAVSIYTP